MEIQERDEFNMMLVNWCINRVQWKSAADDASAKDQVQTCLTKVIAAEQVYRADLLQGRPGYPTWSGFEED